MSLKIISYNIHKGLSPSNLNFSLEKIKCFLEEEAADIVFLQEAVGEHSGKKHIIPNFESNNQVEYLAEGLYPFAIYGANKNHKLGSHGNAILSKLPLKIVENHDISQHRFESRGLLHVTCQLPNSELHLLNTHLNLLEVHRQKQIKWIHNYLDKELLENHSIILAGDFNDWRKKIIHFIHQEGALKEAFGHPHESSPNSFPSFLPTLSLDRIFYKNLKLKESHQYSGKKFTNMSDHLPLLAQFTLEKR